MSALTTVAPKPVTVSQSAARLALASPILLRLTLANGATRAELARDVRPVTRPDLSAADWRVEADAALDRLVRDGLVTESRSRLKATDTGVLQAAAVLGAPIPAKATWLEIRDGALVARALGLDPADRVIIKALANADTLRALIVQGAFGIGVGKPMSLGKLRAALAVRALERAFGNQIKSGLGSGGGLAAKPSRVLAGQLSKTPRDFGSDGRLIAALAAEHLGTANSEIETLRLALLLRYASQRATSPAASPSSSVPMARAPHAQPTVMPAPLPPVANDAGHAGQRPLPSARPDLAGFIAHVKAAATRRADGWAGNRKAFISHVYDDISSAHTAWSLSEIEFKAMLAEAHRTGGLVLATADLKDKKYIQDFEKSAIQYRNTVWHYIRVEEK